MVQKIQYTDNLKEGTDKLNQSIDQSNAAILQSNNADQKSTQALNNSVSTQTQLDNIVVEGDSSVEAAQARVDSSGTSHPTLKSRIDNFEVSATQQLQHNTKQIAKFERVQIEKLGDVHSSGFYYTAFSSGVNFGGKEIYVSRSANDHYTDETPANWGKIIFYIREDNGVFTPLIAPLDYVGSDGEYRDPNLSVSKDGKHLFLSCSANDGNDNLGGFMWVFNEDLNLISSRIQIVPYGIRFVWGNILQTPSGKLIKVAYRTGKDGSGMFGIDIYRTTNPVVDDFSTITFEVINSFNYSAEQRLTETTIGYWQDKLVFVGRVNGQNSIYLESYNLEGDGFIGGLRSIRGQLHSPVMQQYNDDGYLLVGGSLYTGSNNLRQPAIMFIGNNMEFSTPVVIDKDIEQYSGYPTLVKSRYGYGIMYHEDNSPATLSSLWFKEINPIAFLPTIKNTKLTKRLPFDYHEDIYLDNTHFTGTMFFPKSIFKSDVSSLDIVIKPTKNVMFYGMCTYLRSNTLSTVTSSFQLRLGGTTIRNGNSAKDVTNISTDRPQLYTYLCTGIELEKGNTYTLRINGDVTAFCNTIDANARYFEIGKSGILYENVLKGGSVQTNSNTSAVPVGLIVN